MLPINKSFNDNFEGDEIILYASIVSIIIIKILNLKEINILSNFFQAFSQNREVLSSYLNAKNSSNT